MSADVIPDYQEFELGKDGEIVSYGNRMAAKMECVARWWHPFGKKVLDVGCDFGFWCFLASQEGAEQVLGIDRNRTVRGAGYVDLVKRNNFIARKYMMHNRVSFKELNLGRQWWELGQHDIVLMMSLYHHVYNNCGEHEPIWYWLWRHAKERVIWENPVDSTDVVVRKDVRSELQDGYTKERILKAASRFFRVTEVGKNQGNPTREVWSCEPLEEMPIVQLGDTVRGAGGASKAFKHQESRRVGEIYSQFGFKPRLGSLNVSLDEPFDWDYGYYPGYILDLVDRRTGLDGPWADRQVRLYPLRISRLGDPSLSRKGYGMRFLGEKYPKNFLEVIGPVHYRMIMEMEHEDTFFVEVRR